MIAANIGVQRTFARARSFENTIIFLLWLGISEMCN